MIIDVHHHFVPRAYLDRLEEVLPPGLEVRRKEDLLSIVRTADGYLYPPIFISHWSDPYVQLVAMDQAGVSHAVVSAACFPDWMTIEGARLINDGTAELVKKFPDRFSGMISIPPDGGEDMAIEIRRAHALGLCAVNHTTTHGDRYPDHPDFRLMFATAADLGIPVYMHPSWIGPHTTYMDQWNLERTLGKPHDLVLGLSRMLFSGEFARHPGLKMMFGHFGGTLPMMLKRLFFGQKGYTTTPDTDWAALLKRVYVDTGPGMWQSHEEVTYATRKLGADQVLLGSDYPLGLTPQTIMIDAVAYVKEAELSDQEKQKIMCLNARRLFHLDRLAEGPVRVLGCDC